MADETNRYRIALMIVSGVLAVSAVVIIVILFLANQSAQDDVAALELQVLGLEASGSVLKTEIDDLQESNEEMQSTNEELQGANEELSQQLSDSEEGLFAATSTTTVPIRSVALTVGVYDSWQRLGDTGCLTTRRPVDMRFINEGRQLLVFDAGSNALVAAAGVGEGTVETDRDGFDYCLFETVAEFVLDADVYRIAVEGAGDDGIAYPVADIRSRGYAMGLVYFDVSAEERRERQRQSG